MLLQELMIILLFKDAGYMRICICICNRIFCQNPHIAYFSTYNGIFKMACAKIMPHIQKFAHMRQIFSAFFLSNFVLKPLNILSSRHYRYLQLDV